MACNEGLIQDLVLIRAKLALISPIVFLNTPVAALKILETRILNHLLMIFSCRFKETALLHLLHLLDDLRLSKIISMKFQSFLILLKSPELLPSNRQPKTTPEFKILY